MIGSSLNVEPSIAKQLCVPQRHKPWNPTILLACWYGRPCMRSPAINCWRLSLARRTDRFNIKLQWRDVTRITCVLNIRSQERLLLTRGFVSASATVSPEYTSMSSHRALYFHKSPRFPTLCTVAFYSLHKLCLVLSFIFYASFILNLSFLALFLPY